MTMGFIRDTFLSVHGGTRWGRLEVGGADAKFPGEIARRHPTETAHRLFGAAGSPCFLETQSSQVTSASFRLPVHTIWELGPETVP